MTVRIRRAVEADLPAVSELVVEYAAADGHDADQGTIRAGVQPLLADDRYGVIWLAVRSADDEVGVEPVGYAAVTWGFSIEAGGIEVVLDEIYVRCRGCGIGSRLIEHLEADCRRRGARRIFLETERPNDAARRLYARHGFVADDSIWMAKDLR